mgnify:CR=1 FL=1
MVFPHEPMISSTQTWAYMYNGHPCDLLASPSLRVRVQGGGRDSFSGVVHMCCCCCCCCRCCCCCCCCQCGCCCRCAAVIFLVGQRRGQKAVGLHQTQYSIFPRAYTQAPQSLAPSHPSHACMHAFMYTRYLHTCLLCSQHLSTLRRRLLPAP